MESLLVIAAIGAACYYVSLRRWPETKCRRCQGGGRNAGSNSRRFGRCRRCKGSGRQLRHGARVLELRRKRQRERR